MPWRGMLAHSFCTLLHSGCSGEAEHQVSISPLIFLPSRYREEPNLGNIPITGLLSCVIAAAKHSTVHHDTEAQLTHGHGA